MGFVSLRLVSSKIISDTSTVHLVPLLRPAGARRVDQHWTELTVNNRVNRGVNNGPCSINQRYIDQTETRRLRNRFRADYLRENHAASVSEARTDRQPANRRFLFARPKLMPDCPTLLTRMASQHRQNLSPKAMVRVQLIDGYGSPST